MLQVVLVYPEIPPNTGNIARTCAATNTPLHLVEPLGFEISDRQLKRAGLDYWEYVNLQVHPNLEALKQVATGRLVCFSVYSDRSFRDFQFQAGDWLLFGSESKGLPKDLIVQCENVCIPMEHPKVRSLNLSVSAALGLFEARRQLGL
ncbi:tRNA (cytidine(34)-2'-O)-methyltransferase [Tumidithrix helvetica PCC 7403]|uniref:Putative tRNA (cytidine(34)-2'-O)-methyltransferase n=1 Tax=Tumidithrix elongata BACA0141 TaxID=2716417 RepID=A0AAW9PQN7_9CYAN|nr:tRNA (cytidine(34)-2'-O)-methyltransferase [Tumidithrix elongata RA019]